jgi:hypothetical protein
MIDGCAEIERQLGVSAFLFDSYGASNDGFWDKSEVHIFCLRNALASWYISSFV